MDDHEVDERDHLIECLCNTIWDAIDEWHRSHAFVDVDDEIEYQHIPILWAAVDLAAEMIAPRPDHKKTIKKITKLLDVEVSERRKRPFIHPPQSIIPS